MTDTVLEMPSLSAEHDKTPPHLQAPRYVHHFDTWSLVRDLDSGSFGTGQSVTLMKAVRQILADNMELARQALVSKSNVENVSTARCNFDDRGKCTDFDFLLTSYRRHTFSAQHVQNSRPKSRIIERRKGINGVVKTPGYSTKSTY
jgi:Protein of unknown function (DUF1640)